jgi:hypothetical protein
MIIEESIPYNFTIVNDTAFTRFRTLLNASSVIASGLKVVDIIFDNNIDYNAFLNSIASNPFKISRMYIQMLDNIDFIDQIFVQQKDDTGEKFNKSLFPKLDPAQNLANIYNFDVDIPVDENTLIAFRMPPHSSIRVALYRSLSINKANLLIGESEFTEYKMPNISQFLF